MTVVAESVLEKIEGRMLFFKVCAYAGGERIGEGSHQRCIVQNDRFLARATAKKT